MSRLNRNPKPPSTSSTCKPPTACHRPRVPPPQKLTPNSPVTAAPQAQIHAAGPMPFGLAVHAAIPLGVKWPDGDYTLSVTAKDESGNTVAILTEVNGTVDSVDLTQNPPMLKIGGQSFALDKIKQIVRPGPPPGRRCSAPATN